MWEGANMKKRRGDVFPQKPKRRCSCFLLALILLAILTLPITVYAANEDENANPEPVDDSSLINRNPNAEPVPAEFEQESDDATSSIPKVIDPTSTEITFYKTTTGEGSFGSEIFEFNVVRVADKNGTPWTQDDETFIDNSGIVTVEVGPNQKAVPTSFTINNLKAPDGQAIYFYKISERKGLDKNWNYDEREFILRILVVEVDGQLVVPRQGQEWFYNGVSFDAKGGGNPLPPNDCNTFINEYTGAGIPLGRLKVKKNDFTETPAYPDEKFELQLSTSSDVPVNLAAPGITIRKISGRGTYSGTDLKNGKFTLSYDTEVQIAGLPVGEYSIAEVVVGYETSYTVDGGSGSGSVAKVLVSKGMDTYVAFTNTGKDINTSLTIRKVLSGDYESWSVNNDTYFQARIADARGRYLTFSGTAPNYTYTGTSSTGSEIRFSMGQEAVISGIPIGTKCTVEEIIPSDALYVASYSNKSVEIPGGAIRDADVTVTNTYEDHGVGNITINKKLTGGYTDWGVDANTVFTAVVKDVTDANNIYNLDFQRRSDGNYEAVDIGTGNPYIQLTAGRPVVLGMLWDDHVYEIEEIGGAYYTATYTGNNATLPNGGNMNVTITNTFEHGEGNLIISKRLAGSPRDWGVDENTVFPAMVKDVTDGNYVLFALQPDGKYLAVGNNNSPTPTKDTREQIRFTAGSPAILSGLWTNHVYEVQEAGGSHYKTAYIGNSTILPNGGNMNVTITNTYEHGSGNLVIRKTLEGFPRDWGVDENTVFTARIKDVTDNNYLLFSIQEDGTYLAFGNNGSETPTKDTRELVRFTASKPVVLTGLWVNQEYVVIESAGPNYTASYQGKEAMLPQVMPESGNMNVTITNTFDHGIGNITISKYLAGKPNNWNVNERTVFTARVRDVTDADNKYDIYFDRQPDGQYETVDSGLSQEPTGSPIVRFTASSPITLTKLWENRIYEVVEDGGEQYTATYSGNNAPIPESGNMNVAITNIFGHDIGRLRITKANFVTTPSKPDEVFGLIIENDGNPVDLTKDGINIIKTGGSGEYNAVDLSGGRFSLTYDTEITIFGIPEGAYTITEDVTGYNTSYMVTGNRETVIPIYSTKAAVGVVGGGETAITFTNVETGTKLTNTDIDRDTTTTTTTTPSGNDSENPQTNNGNDNGNGSSNDNDSSGNGTLEYANDERITLDGISLGMEEDSLIAGGSRDAKIKMNTPQTGDKAEISAWVQLLLAVIIGGLVLCFFKLKLANSKECGSKD